MIIGKTRTNQPVENTKGLKEVTSCVYSHHFNININAEVVGGTGTIVIPVNAISNNPTPYETLNDLDGDGYIVSAFGMIELPTPLTAFVFELKLFYKALSNGTCLIEAYDLTSNNVRCYTITNMGSYALEDSVAKI